MRPCTIEEVRAIAQGDLGLAQRDGESEQAFRERVAGALNERTGGAAPLLVAMLRGGPAWEEAETPAEFCERKR